MEDQRIHIDTAKLIPNPKKDHYWDKCEWFYVDKTHKDGYWIGDRNTLDIDYPRPTQSLLQKWLREVHKIHVNCFYSSAPTIMGFVYGVIESAEAEDNLVYETYEEALEVGLWEACKLVIKNQKKRNNE